MDEREIGKQLDKLDLSQESKIRQNLRTILARESKQIRWRASELRIWGGFIVVSLLVICWALNLHEPTTVPALQPQVTAFARTESAVPATSQVTSLALPILPKPIPTPNAFFLTTSQIQETTPSITESPYTTPGMAHQTGLH